MHRNRGFGVACLLAPDGPRKQCLLALNRRPGRGESVVGGSRVPSGTIRNTERIMRQTQSAPGPKDEGGPFGRPTAASWFHPLARTRVDQIPLTRGSVFAPPLPSLKEVTSMPKKEEERKDGKKLDKGKDKGKK